ncbi:hypothetical protein SSPO_056290 [Streptomyces antimycoticus]|uniref:Carbohydrate kinase PfkB domain-containing protein n=1 Tax=Streptomyces antimycoticus TaxID=68175 RepID=A0A499V043_9ACTN|nr:hypothetical protein SSPO_056290 [Streptomyces antimycoticus]
MILTVTLNTALDVTYRVPELRPHATHRVTEVTERPGGKGLNVARVLAALGHDTVVTGFVGGVTGAVLRQLLGGIALPGTGPKAPHGTITDALVPIAGTTRRTIGVVDATTGDTTQLNEPGPNVTTPEWSTFMDAYGRLLREASAVALCGSLPPGSRSGRTPSSSGRRMRRACPPCWTPAANRCAGASPPAPISSSPTSMSSPGSPAPPTRCAPRATPGGAGRARWPPRSAPTACSRSPPTAPGAPPRRAD